jgi:hypothetical protein
VEGWDEISRGQVPRYWEMGSPGVFTGHYSKKRNHGRYIYNSVKVEQIGCSLVVECWPLYLGINWKPIKDNCRRAQEQIRDRLKREPIPDKVSRLVVLFLTTDLTSTYRPQQLEKLTNEINRRVLSKFPELSAAVFCRVFVGDTVQPSGPFLVFHTRNPDIPAIPRRVFGDESAIWFVGNNEASQQ